MIISELFTISLSIERFSYLGFAKNIYILGNKIIARLKRVLSAWKYGKNIKKPCIRIENTTPFG